MVFMESKKKINERSHKRKESKTHKQKFKKIKINNNDANVND